jgi:hypothetical protein
MLLERRVPGRADVPHHAVREVWAMLFRKLLVELAAVCALDLLQRPVHPLIEVLVALARDCRDAARGCLVGAHTRDVEVERIGEGRAALALPQLHARIATARDLTEDLLRPLARESDGQRIAAVADLATAANHLASLQPSGGSTSI